MEAYLDVQEKWNVVRVRKGLEKKKRWIALSLTDIRKYDEIRKPDPFVSVGGKYLKE